MRMRTIAVPIGSILLVSSFLGCASGGGVEGAAATVVGLEEGLVLRPVALPGRLYVRPDHAIGTYDRFLIPESTIAYQDHSLRLPEEAEIVYLAMLEQSLLDAVRDASIEVTKVPGECTLQVQMRLEDVKLTKSVRDEDSMTLVLELRDTLSGSPLLRYETEYPVPSPDEDDSLGEQVSATFDRMVAEMEVSGALRGAGLGASTSRPPCEGVLAQRGQRPILPAVSAE
ncbi:MAG: hypothetical protein R3F16_01795 [Myxococcota bacterium]